MLRQREKPFYLTAGQLNWIDETYAAMTLAEKIGQLFCLTAYRDSDADLHQMMTIRPGGVMLRPMPAAQAAQSIQKMQEASPIPLLIAANLEKGANGLVLEGTNYASPMEIAATDDVEMAWRLGDVCGSEASLIGANWAFAPLLDLDRNFRNPITNTRTFGNDPARVSAMGRAYVRAVQAHRMAATVKHFPGDGCDERDQHLVTAINDLSCEEWDATYGKVYRDCIDEGVMTVMAGHILQPAYSRRLNPALRDEALLPASLSYELITKLLKEQLHFRGLVVTDATTMAGFNIPMPREQLVPAVIAAGCDMFLFCKNLEEDFGFMRRGVEKGVITPERLEDAVKKVLALKAALHLPDRQIAQAQALGKCQPGTPQQADAFAKPGTQPVPGTNPLPEPLLARHREWARECADRSVTLVKEEAGVLPLSAQKTRRILFFPIQSAQGVVYSAASGVAEQFIALLRNEGFEVEVFKPNPNGLEGLMTSQAEMLQGCDLILYLANMATKSNQTTVRIEWAQPMGANVPMLITSRPTIFVSVENPYHLLDVPRVRTYINAYHSSPEVLEAIVDKLMGRSRFVGKSPVDPFCGKWDTRL